MNFLFVWLILEKCGIYFMIKNIGNYNYIFDIKTLMIKPQHSIVKTKICHFLISYSLCLFYYYIKLIANHNYLPQITNKHII